jgi:hypothetical protein
MKHDLKIWPQYYCRVADGSKTFEVRNNDRGFQPGDEVELHEWDPQEVNKGIDSFGDCNIEPIGYTNKSLSFKVGYVLPIDAERVVFSLLPLDSK